MSDNRNLNKAQFDPEPDTDEFYTMKETVENELKHHYESFKGKVIHLAFDGPRSEFVKYFYRFRKQIEYEEVIATAYNPYGKGRIQRFRPDFIEPPGELQGDGDALGDEVLRISEAADIVVSNPPFSIFNKLVRNYFSFNTDILLIGLMAQCSSSVFNKEFMRGRVRFGYSGRPKGFLRPDGSIASVAANWFTSLPVSLQHPFRKLTKEYDPDKYPKYDNYDAIECSSIRDIPKDYKGLMGVPVNILETLNPNQFEVIGFERTLLPEGMQEFELNGKRMFHRVVIRHAGQEPLKMTVNRKGNFDVLEYDC